MKEVYIISKSEINQLNKTHNLLQILLDEEDTPPKLKKRIYLQLNILSKIIKWRPKED